MIICKHVRIIGQAVSKLLLQLSAIVQSLLNVKAEYFFLPKIAKKSLSCKILTFRKEKTYWIIAESS